MLAGWLLLFSFWYVGEQLIVNDSQSRAIGLVVVAKKYHHVEEAEGGKWHSLLPVKLSRTHKWGWDDDAADAGGGGGVEIYCSVWCLVEAAGCLRGFLRMATLR